MKNFPQIVQAQFEKLGTDVNVQLVVANENQRLAEMVSYFKNKLILENCFTLTFAVVKQEGSAFANFK